MKILKFDATKRICKNLFRENQNIDQIYFELAEIVLVRLYKAFPFDSLFEGFSWDNKPNESFQSCLIAWADAFMSWQINDLNKVNKAITYLIEKCIIPSLGIFKAAYEGNYKPIQIAEYELYITYLNRNGEWNKDGHQRTGSSLMFQEWLYEEKSKLVYDLLS